MEKIPLWYKKTKSSQHIASFFISVLYHSKYTNYILYITLYIDNITLPPYNKYGDIMEYVDLCQPILFRHASLRYFDPHEYHITRHCADDVLLLVYEGVLRFRENGIDREVSAGEYYIQKAGLLQEGTVASDCPKYLYAHFRAKWTDAEGLPVCGPFYYPQFQPLIEKLDKLSHSRAPYVEKTGCFYEVLSLLFRQQHTDSPATCIAQFIDEHFAKISGLEDLCAHFHYSKNHIICLFRKAYSITPVTYINDAKLRHAMYLLEVTSDSAEQISLKSGFHTYSHFYRLFLRKTGQTPAQWRKAISLSPPIAF